jgi:hypothetical protein
MRLKEEETKEKKMGRRELKKRKRRNTRKTG